MNDQLDIDCSLADPACSLQDKDELDDESARVYAALSNAVRLTILRQLSLQENCCCKDIVGGLDLAQSTVSQHLKVLVQAGLVDYRPDRQASRYSVNNTKLAQIRDHLVQLAALSAGPQTAPNSEI